MPKSKIDIPVLTQYFADTPDRALTLSDLESLRIEKARVWNLPSSMTPSTFLHMLLSRTNLTELRLRSNYSSPRLFSWGSTASPLSVATSIKKDAAFFSHASAMWIHGLGENQKNIFVNKEQSEKRQNSGRLSQEAIDRAFRNQQRRSKLVYKIPRCYDHTPKRETYWTA